MLRKLIGSTSTLLLLCAVLVGAALLGRVASRTTIVRLGYALSSANTKNQVLAAEVNALRTELAARASPDALARDAKRHGLDTPKPEQIVTVRGRPGASPRSAR